MSNNLKMILNRLQSHIVPEYESDNVLYIFENETEKIRYNQLLLIKHKNTPNMLLYSISNLCLPNRLDGLRFKRYWFVTDEDFKRLEK